MISSMTGYAAGSLRFAGLNLSLDLRSVNSRYLEIHFRCTDEFRFIEPRLRERIAAGVQRGKLECRITLDAAAAGEREFQLDHELLARLVNLSAAITGCFPAAAPLSVAEVLRWPGILNDAGIADDLAEPCQQLLDTVLAEFIASREREGGKLAAHLLERVERMEQLIARIGPNLPGLVRAYQHKLTQRFIEALGSADDERIRQEIALFAQKIDVDEELSRLGVHLGEVRAILSRDGAVGKRLDFLMQELNREANTLGSKSVSMETTQAAMELKVLIEQMREQIQNLE